MEGIYAYGVLKIQDKDMSENEIIITQGIDPTFPVRIIKHNRLGVAVSQVPLMEFSEEALHEHIQNNLQWIEEKARIHTHIMEVINENSTILPFQFCTIYKNEESILDMLDKNYDYFCILLKKVENKTEWTIKILCNTEILKKNLYDMEREKLKSELDNKPRGMAYLLKKKIEESINQDIDRYLTEHVNNVYNNTLKIIADDIIVENTFDKNVTTPEKTLLKCSLLIKKDRQEDFIKKINEINKLNKSNGIAIKLSGPWPPYSFTKR